MKKCVSILLTLILALGTAACGQSDSSAEPNGASNFWERIGEALHTDEMLSDLTDDGIHRYTYHLEDCTWEEAFSLAEEQGGYLVRINSQEELDYIINEITQLGYEKKYFFLGGRRDMDGTDYYWVDEDNQLIGDALNGGDDWMSDVWLPGEPTVVFAGIEEPVLSMEFNKKNDRWGWNDLPEDPLSVDSGKSGNLVYIVEYDD